MTILTDPGYIGEGDVEGLRSILSRSKAIGDVVAVLPLHLSWVRDRDGLRILLDEVQGHGAPMALGLEQVVRPPADNSIFCFMRSFHQRGGLNEPPDAGPG
jgi:hypothetical protein